MKKNIIIKYILVISLIFVAPGAYAQFGKRLKDRAKEAAERKADQKVDETINKGADKIDSVITGKKRDKKNKTQTETQKTNTASGNSNSSNNEVSEPSPESIYNEVTIKTNILCPAGKKKIEAMLRDTDGVSSVMIDNTTGKLYLSAEQPEVTAKAIELVRQNGFEADGKKPTKPIPNPCK